MRILPPVLALLLAAAPAAQADSLADLDGALAAAVEDAFLAQRGILEDDRAVVLDALDRVEGDAAAALAAAADAGACAALGKSCHRLVLRATRLLAAADAARADAGDGEASAAAVSRRLARVAKAAVAARRAFPGDLAAGATVLPASGAFRRPGSRFTVRVLPGLDGEGAPCTEAPVLSVVEEGPGAALDGDPEDLGGGRFRFRLGDGPGTALVTVAACGVERRFRVLNRGPAGSIPKAAGWGGAGSEPSTIVYASPSVSLRAGAAAAVPAPSVTGGLPARYFFTADPPLPDGLLLDPETGAVAGTPSGSAVETVHAITAANVHGSVTFDLAVEATPALPEGMEWLEDGFAAEEWVEGLFVAAKMARLPDGRILVSEHPYGLVRVVEPDGTLLPDPFATVAISAGGEKGLLGIAPDPDFADTGFVFVYAVVPAGDGHPVRGQILRFTAVGDVGTAPVVIVDDLPAGNVQDGGDLRFGPDGMLYLSIGDTGDSALAQDDASLAGRILRYTPAGGIPADNPDPASPEFCRGLRNPYDTAFHPGTGGLFCTENGPTFGDEVNLLLPGRNYGWETLPPDFPLPLVGPRIAEWTPVIVPTGLAFHDGKQFGAEYADDLFVATYDEAGLRRLVLSGTLHTDLDEEVPFARWDDTGGVDHKPLDLLELPDGTLLVSTFSGIWRITRWTPREE